MIFTGITDARSVDESDKSDELDADDLPGGASSSLPLVSLSQLSEDMPEGRVLHVKGFIQVSFCFRKRDCGGGGGGGG
jgi:hypothetical protein